MCTGSVAIAATWTVRETEKTTGNCWFGLHSIFVAMVGLQFEINFLLQWFGGFGLIQPGFHFGLIQHLRLASEENCLAHCHLEALRVSKDRITN